MHLQVGDHAPAFTGKDQEEKTIQLADFAGKKLVLYFYPKDNTPGCTAQAVQSTGSLSGPPASRVPGHRRQHR